MVLSRRTRASAGLPEMAPDSLDVFLSVESSQPKGLLSEWKTFKLGERQEMNDVPCYVPC